MDFQSALVAGLAGAAVGGGAYALDGADIENHWKAAILGAGGLAIGALAGGYSKPAAAGAAGGGLALAAKMLLDQYMAKNGGESASLGRIPAYAYNKFGATPTRPHYYHMPAPVYAQLDAVQADLGAVQANLGNVYADIT